MRAANNSLVRANRIKSTRMLAGFNRKKFSEISGISIPTLKAWEMPDEKRKGLTFKGAVRLSKSFKACNIDCSAEWLYNGLGASPSLLSITSSSLFKSDIDEQAWEEEEAILRDLEAYKKHNKDSIVLTVSDAAMVPFFKIGELVGGRVRTGEDIKKLIGLNCIIHLSNKTLVRKIISVNENNRYTVSSYNQKEDISDLILVNVDIIYAAEIVWHRKREAMGNTCKDKDKKNESISKKF